MRILMLGWEYPPHISGGLGTACEGLTSALSRRGVFIDFVVPHLSGDETAGHMNLIDPLPEDNLENQQTGSVRINTIKVPSLLSPYLNKNSFEDFITHLELGGVDFTGFDGTRGGISAIHYGPDIFSEVEKYAVNIAEKSRGLSFDAVHAHDWMTFPAAIAVSRKSGKPFIAHVHSLEYDRSGEHVNPRIDYIENLGVRAASAVVAVSHYTKSLITNRHNVSPEKIKVVHNGVYTPLHKTNKKIANLNENTKIVLFLGRVTFQKGPDYFVAAAKKVLEKLDDVHFIMAGSGDMLERMKRMAVEANIYDYMSFPGFLKGKDVEKAFAMADLYVMPSVSEPFGISALEAISYETPVIISKQSGVSEVLDHALKVDFWDIDRMADLIINGLIHPELRQDMISMAKEEVKRLKWDASAAKTIEIYNELI